MSSDGRAMPQGIDSAEGARLLADPRNRRVLSVLEERSHPLTSRDVGVLLGAAVCGSSPARVPDGVLQRVRTDLHHRCLPALDDAGLIDRYPEGWVVTEEGAQTLEGEERPTLAGSDQQYWDAVAAMLARPRRRELLSIVADGGPLSIEELATRLGAGEANDRPTPDTPDESTATDASTAAGESTAAGASIASTLHHVDLPQLAAVDLLAYDQVDQTVAPTPELATLRERTGLVGTAGADLDAD